MSTPANDSQHPSRPLLTFVVPVYDTEPSMLRECIDSLLAVQLAPGEREVLVVDDGSERVDVAKVVEGMGAGVHVMRREHEGVSSARNAGMEQAQGEYVQFVDADDSLDAACYARCLEAVRRERPDVVMLRYRGQTTKDKVQRSETYETGVQYMLENNVRGSCCNYIVRRDVARKTAFPVGVRFTEDERWTAQMLLKAGRIIDTHLPAYCYRQHAESATGSTSKEVRVQKIADAFATIAFLDYLCGTLSGREQEALRRRVAQLTMDFIWNVWRWTHSPRDLHRQVGLLRERGLFPLPQKNYSRKYALFSALTRIWIF